MPPKRKAEAKAEGSVGKRTQARLDAEKKAAEEKERQRELDLATKIEAPPPKAIRELWAKCGTNKQKLEDMLGNVNSNEKKPLFSAMSYFLRTQPPARHEQRSQAAQNDQAK
ncbi:unnamed protein product, partial [Prorocentrum cordatum]